MNCNDDAVATVVKESVSGVHMDVPAEQIVSRSRARRARRRIRGMAGALVAVAAVALPATTLLSSGHVASVRPAAWTVALRPDGNVFVTVRELRHPARLQARLRADGIPASIESPGHRNPGCRIDNDKKDPSAIEQIIQNGPQARRGEWSFTIRRSAIPRGTGVLVGVVFEHHNSGPLRAMELGLVHASPQCTGS